MTANTRASGPRRDEAFRLHASGRLDLAERLYRDVLRQQPDDFEVWNNLGNLLAATSRPEEAVQALGEAVNLRPDVAPVRLNLAGVHVRAGRPDLAVSVLEDAAEAAMGDPAILLELSRAHAQAGNESAALETLQRLKEVLPEEPVVRVEEGLIHASSGAFAEAEQCYREALRLRASFAAAWFYLGLLLEHSNRWQELGTLLGDAEQAGVAGGELALIRAYHLRRQGDLAGALSAARQSPAHVEPMRRAQLVGELADRLGESGTAFAAFAEMNRFSAASLPGARDIAAVYRAEIKAGLDRLDREAEASRSQPVSSQVPVFLVGFPRSGTTLLDTMLMGHPALHVLEEQPTLEPIIARIGGLENVASLDDGEAGNMRSLYWQTVAEMGAPAGRRLVDKMPLNIVRLPLIRRLFPNATILLSLRHPCDVVLSCWTTAFRLNYAMANFLDLEDAARLYDQVMTYWVRAQQAFGFEAEEIRYEVLIEDPEAVARHVACTIGVAWDPGMVRHRETAARRDYVASASYAQVTEPLYRRAVGRWERYRPQLEPVLPLLEPWVKRFGYTL